MGLIVVGDKDGLEDGLLVGYDKWNYITMVRIKHVSTNDKGIEDKLKLTSRVGEFEGALDGLYVGRFEGDLDGSYVGVLEGGNVGLSVGLTDGCWLGMNVGVSVL